MPRTRTLLPVLAALACAGMAGTAWGVIKVDLPMSRVYDTSKAVAVGTVTAADAGTLQVKTAETLKGDPVGDAFRLQAATADLVKDVAPGQPVALFVAKARGGALALVHVADEWLMAELVPAASPPTWRLVRVHADTRASFPGRTAALVRLLADLKAGRPAILNKAEPDVLRGGARQVAQVALAGPRLLAAADVSGDGRADLLAVGAGGLRLLVADGDGFRDATDASGLAGAKGGAAAFGDVDGDKQMDLLLGARLWRNAGGRFAPAAALDVPEGDPVLAAALADATGDGRPDALLLLADGRALVLENPGAADRPWPARPPRPLWSGGPAPLAAALGDFGGDGRPSALVVRADGPTRYPLDGGPPDAGDRLTGAPFASYHKALEAGLKDALVTALDVNGDRRTDFLLLGGGAGLLFVNRGYGAFLVLPDAGEALAVGGGGRPSVAPSAARALASADLRGDGCDDLLVLAEDGRLLAVDNPAPSAAGAKP